LLSCREFRFLFEEKSSWFESSHALLCLLTCVSAGIGVQLRHRDLWCRATTCDCGDVGLSLPAAPSRYGNGPLGPKLLNQLGDPHLVCMDLVHKISMKMMDIFLCTYLWFCTAESIHYSMSPSSVKPCTLDKPLNGSTLNLVRSHQSVTVCE
jgi:hypothetical protein